MVSLVINSLSLWQGTNYTAEVLWQPPAREIKHQALDDSDEPDACRADAQAVGRYSGIGVEYEAERAPTKDGAGGGPAEERTCARGRGMRLFKIRESRTRMRGRDDSFRIVRLTRIQISLSNGTISREPSARLVVSAVQ